MRADQPIERFMSPSPHTIGKDQTVAVARELMHRHRIRHLPVLDGGALIGVISDRDVAFASSIRGAYPDQMRVEEAMMSETYWVTRATPLGPVVRHMAQHRLGSVVVMDANRVVGILTTVDALRILGECLEESAGAQPRLN